MVWKGMNQEDPALFKLIRHHEGIGLNRMLPLMKGMKVLIFESRITEGIPGMVLAQSDWGEEADDGEPGTPVHRGYSTYLEKAIEWHGADTVRWMERKKN